MKKVLFYGTLMRGFHNWSVYVQPMISNDQAKFLYEGVSVDEYPLCVHSDRNVPALYNAKGIGKHVTGEVWEVNANGLEALDIIEGVSGGFYSTGTIRMTDKSKIGGEGDDCYVYFKGSGGESGLGLNHPIDFTTMSERVIEEQEIMQWILNHNTDKDPSCLTREDINSVFLDTFTRELHEEYTLNKLFPDALAKATLSDQSTIEALLQKKTTEGVFEGKTKRELSQIYAELYKEL